MTEVAIIREPDDAVAETRISTGKPRGVDGIYIVFRGDPDRVVETLKRAYELAKERIPGGEYEDRRRPQA